MHVGRSAELRVQMAWPTRPARGPRAGRGKQCYVLHPAGTLVGSIQKAATAAHDQLAGFICAAMRCW